MPLSVISATPFFFFGGGGNKVIRRISDPCTVI